MISNLNHFQPILSPQNVPKWPFLRQFWLFGGPKGAKNRLKTSNHNQPPLWTAGLH